MTRRAVRAGLIDWGNREGGLMASTPASTIRIFLADGTAEGLRIIEKSNWTGKAVSCSRSQFPHVKRREEFQRPGVYLLVGMNDSKNLPIIYVGEGDPVGPRLESHITNKDFWTHLVLFSSKDQFLNKAHIQYLESRLVQLAKESKRSQLENGNAPTLPALSEADTAEMENFLSEMLVIYPVLNVTAFETSSLPVEAAQTDAEFQIRIGDGFARGYDRPEGFVVLSGSWVAKDETPSLQALYRAERKALLENGALAQKDNHLEFTQNYTFNSPSRASCVVLGRSSNGLADWKSNIGKSLREVQSSKIG
jgi:hypothetical protein